MKLNDQQLQRLAEFTRQHYVEWYDLQCELVDHLANAIEARWEQEPSISFENALSAEFKKFGIFGFMDVAEAKGKHLNSRYMKMIWSHYKDFLGLPKILLTIGLIIVLYLLARVTGNSAWTYFVTFAVLVAITLYHMVRQSARRKAVFKETGRKWMFEEMVTGMSAFPFVILPVQLLNFWQSFIGGHSLGNTGSLIASTLVILYGLLMYIQIKVVPVRISRELESQYPEYRSYLV